jgi:CubicO group peptidase (beta-lactamase class C family)
VLQLRDRGKFGLEDAVALYLPDFAYKDIKIRHLLTHTSGLPDLELFEDLVKQFPDTVISNGDVMPELLKWGNQRYAIAYLWIVSGHFIQLSRFITGSAIQQFPFNATD